MENYRRVIEIQRGQFGNCEEIQNIDFPEKIGEQNQTSTYDKGIEK